MKPRWILLLALLGALLVTGTALPGSAPAAECLTCEGEEEPPFEELEQPLTITVEGIGSVQQGATGYCENTTGGSKTCEIEFPEGEALTLSAHPGNGLTFSGWTGDCTGTGNCQLTMDEAHSVTATFADTTAPAAPAITSPTSGQIFERTAEEPVQVVFGNNGDVSTAAYLCSLDLSFGGVPCSSPWSTGNLSAGSHTVYVWAKDSVGNVSGPASRSFEVVISPPGGGEEGGEEEGGPKEEGGSGEPGGTPGGGTPGTGSGGTATTSTGAPGTGSGAGTSVPPPTPKINAKLIAKWNLAGGATVFRKLGLKGLPAGANVVATCAGKGCPFKRKQAKAPKGVVDLTKLFSGRELAANVLIRLQVSAPGMLGQTIQLKTRVGKPPKTTKS